MFSYLINFDLFQSDSCVMNTQLTWYESVEAQATGFNDKPETLYRLFIILHQLHFYFQSTNVNFITRLFYLYLTKLFFFYFYCNISAKRKSISQA